MESKCTIFLQRNELLAMRELQSKDPSRFVLNAVYFEVSQGRVILTATNGRILGTLLTDSIVENCQQDGASFICDYPMVRHLPKPSQKESLGRIRVDYDGTNVLFFSGGQTVVSKAVEGDFPKWRQIIPRGKIIPSDFNLNPAYLVQFMKVSKALGFRSDGVRLRAHESDNGCYKVAEPPYSVFLDNANFYGALMPMRYDEPTMPKWLEEEAPAERSEAKPEPVAA